MSNYLPVPASHDDGDEWHQTPRSSREYVDRDGYGNGYGNDLSSYNSNETQEIQQTDTHYDRLMPKIEKQPVEYHLYKRRWIGLSVMTAMTFFVAMAGQTFSPVALYAEKYFGVPLTSINWLGTIGLLVYLPACPLVIFVVGKYGPKMSLMIAAILTIIGLWIQFAGAKTQNFTIVLISQAIHGIAQPFLISTPTRYSRMWFDQRGMTVATAIPSLSLSIGAAVGSLIVPHLVVAVGLSGVSLIVACLATAASLCAFFVPKKPPTPPSAIEEELKLSVRESLKLLPHMKPFYLQFFGFAVYTGAFQAASTLIITIIHSYSFTETEGGNAGAIMIFIGLGSAALFSYIVDKTKKHLLIVKIMVPLIACSYTALIFVPQTRSVAGLYIIYGAIGFTSFAIMPATLEFQANWTHPVSPVVSSAICWMGGQLFAAIFILVINYTLILKRPEFGQPAGSAYPGLIFIACMTWLTVPAVMLTGLWIFKKPETAVEGRYG